MKRLIRLAKIVGSSILVFTQSIPCVAARDLSASAAQGSYRNRHTVAYKTHDNLSNSQAENPLSGAMPTFRGKLCDPTPRADFAALVAEKTESVHSLQKTEIIYFAASEFLGTVRNDTMLKRFLKMQDARSQRLDFANMHTFMMNIVERLPKFRTLFERQAEAYDLDWRLLAAIAYQESHWNPEAVSPTGVRGLMMLTRDTASYVGITNRTDPEQSVKGGAKYFKIVKKKIPKRIPEPDRTWLALASYNVGFGHLEDARILTQSLGGNPDSWQDVKKRLPLLSVQKWHRRTKHGYARGHEPVKYVHNIRNYYSLLKLLTRDIGGSARADVRGELPDS